MNFMQDISHAYHISFSICGGIFCIVCLFMLTAIRYYDRERANYLTVYLIACSVLGFSEATAAYFRGTSSVTAFVMVRVATFLVFSMLYFMAGLGAFYLRRIILNSLPENFNDKKLSERLYYVSYIGAGLCAIGEVLLILSQFFDIFYAFDEFNSYYRLQPSFLQQVIPGSVLLISFLAIVPYIRFLEIDDRISIILSVVVLLTTAVLTVPWYGGGNGMNAAQITGIVLFIGFQRSCAAYGKRREQVIKAKDAAIAEQRARVMQNQIRPHFIFNSLLAIKQLCIEDPGEAADALQHFSTFLRANLESMTDDTPVPVTKELDCIKEYVALEQADPANRFTVRYEITFTDFKVPLLSVEPMVENAIRHGIATKKSGGEVIIRTAREGDTAVITVEDNGSGFGSETMQQAKHRSVGIQNSRDRLELMCGGTLSIVNTGNGTIVRMCVPIRQETEDAGQN